MVFAYMPWAILTSTYSATNFLSTRPVWSRSDKSKKSMGVKTESLLRLSRYLILLSKVLRAIILFYKYTILKSMNKTGTLPDSAVSLNHHTSTERSRKMKTLELEMDNNSISWPDFLVKV